MLLKVGVAMMLVSLVLAAGVAAAVVGLREETPETRAVSSAQRQTAEETAEQKNNPTRGEKLDINERSREEPTPEPEPEPEPALEPRPESRPDVPRSDDPWPNPQPDPAPLLVATEWPQPDDEELVTADEPRYFSPDPSAGMSLSVPAIGLYDVPVISSPDLTALDTSLMHDPETSLPWEDSPQRNVFIAGHYLGYPGTASRLVFYNLDKLEEGDEAVLTDGLGREYRYRVRESFGASPEESWVMGQEVGRDMLTLQTCIPPDFAERLIVRADRV